MKEAVLRSHPFYPGAAILGSVARGTMAAGEAEVVCRWRPEGPRQSRRLSKLLQTGGQLVRFLLSDPSSAGMLFPIDILYGTPIIPIERR